MRTEEKEQQQAILKGSLNFMDAGGVLTPAIPSRQQIIESIDKSYPVVAAAYASAWGKDQGTYHFVVIGGYSDDKFLIYNPKSESRQKSWEGIDQVMYGIHTSTAFDYDNGSILIVSKN